MQEANASTYGECAALAQTRKRKLDNNTYLIVHDDHYAIKLHNTEIVKHFPDRTEFYTGGWKTVTTKDRMNKFSRHCISQSGGVWYLDDCVFADGITVYSDCSVTGEGEDPKEQQKWRKAANQYAKDYVKALFAGEVPAPSGGDCWGCLFTTDTGETGIGRDSHMQSHIEEKYYVPSILNRVAPRLSEYAKGVIGNIWNGYGTPATAGIVAHQIERAVRWYALHEMGLVT